jgi:hypothetical protein
MRTYQLYEVRRFDDPRFDSAAFNSQEILLAGDRDLVWFEAGYRYRDAIGIGASSASCGLFSRSWSKPMLDRAKGVKSKVLIATSSVEQHGYKQRAGHPPTPAPDHLASGDDEIF